MAGIILRYGLKSQFDPNKLVPSQFGYITDTKELYFSYAPGDVRKIATLDNITTTIEEALEQITTNYLASINQAISDAETATGEAETAAANAQDKADYAYEKGQEAQAIVHSASPIINTNLQATYADKGTITGQSAHFTTADDGLIALTSIKGKSSQTTTTQGKQLFDKAKITASKYIQPDTGVVTNSTYNNNVSAKIYVGTNTNVTLSGMTFTQPNTPVGIAFYNSSNTRIGGTSYQNATGNGTYAIPVNTAYFRHTVNNVDLNTAQAEFGITATSYASFVPDSPSPDYPSPITGAGDMAFDIEACGKNILPKSTINTLTVTGITATLNTDGSITLNGTATNLTNITILGAYGSTVQLAKIFKNTSYTLKGTGNSGVTIYLGYASENAFMNANATDKTFNLTEDKIISRVSISIANGTAINNLIIYPQLELGSTSTPYEPHQSNKLTISGLPMNDLPNGTADEIVQNTDGSWKHVKRENTVVFDGSADENWVLNSTNTKTLRFYINGLTGGKAVDYGVLLCNRFNPVTTNDSTDTEHCRKSTSAYPNDFYIWINKDRLSTPDVSGFKTWLASNPITVRYELATPIETQLTDKYYLTSYKGITNVFTTSNPQVTFTAVAKSELRSNQILIDIGLQALQAGKIDKTAITGLSTTNDPNKVPSSQVTHALAEDVAELQTDVNTLDNDLTKIYNLETAGFVTDFNGGGNAITPGRWKVYNDSGTAAHAPYSGATSGYVDVVISGNMTVSGSRAYQTFFDYLGDVYFKIIEAGTGYGTWKKLTN